jgi:uncharacterized protein YbjT (DUF2867 family)
MILVAGGTGTLGTRLVQLLVRERHTVRVLARDAAHAPASFEDGVEVVAGNVRDAEAVARAMAGATSVVSAVTGFGPHGDGSRAIDADGNADLIGAAQAAGVEHFVLMSVCQAAPDHPIELFRMKHVAEQALAASGLARTIVRPTAYMETWVTLLGAPLLEKGKTRIFGRGQNPINFVSADDVARLVARAITDPSMRGAIVEIGGPADLTMTQVVETFEAVTGAGGTIGHVPLSAMRAMRALMKPFNASISGLIEAAVVMDTRDMRFEPPFASRPFLDEPMTTLEQVVRHHYSGASREGYST